MDAGHSLAEFLRARRGRIRPADAGIVNGDRRRVPGLRREELALLAGLSADYYTRLEQGRDYRPSERVLQSLARALQLDADATDHLFALGGLASPGARSRDRADEEVRSEVQALIDGWGTPAFIHGRHLDILASNAAARALTRVAQPGTNMLRSMFLIKEEYERYEDLEFTLARAVAYFRAIVGGDLDEPYIQGAGRGAVAQERGLPPALGRPRRALVGVGVRPVPAPRGGLDAAELPDLRRRRHRGADALRDHRRAGQPGRGGARPDRRAGAYPPHGNHITAPQLPALTGDGGCSPKCAPSGDSDRELSLDVARGGIGRRMRFLAALLVLAAAVPSSAHAGRLLSVRVDGSGQITLASDRKASFGPTPCRAADGTITVLAERPSRLSDRSYLIARAGAKARWKRPSGGEILDATFSPDCTRVAELYYVFPTKSDLSGLLIRETSGKELGRLESDPEEWPTIAWSADGTKFAFDGWERGRGAVLRVVDARNGRVLARHATQQAEVGSQAFSPDGNALVYAEGERLLIMDAATGAARALAGGKDGRYFRAPTWSPRGDQIAAVNSGGGVELLDPQTGHGPALETSAIFAEDMVWSPDASMIAMRFSSSKPGITRSGLAVVATAPGSRPRKLVKAGGSTTLPVWDGASLVFGR